MTKEEALKLMALIEYIYPVVTVKSESILIWMSICVSLKYSFTFENLVKHIRGNPYPPTLTELIDGTGKNRLSFDWLKEYSIKDQ
ncbi:hypothetical protein J7E38_18240 [Bacillus sp. ISL-35]|uniref:replicative helicase loader/inhibitor n=1 Tax=Bacillus sp. ISL-35 TaxID=2819122 RepID=UPI001BE9BC59|nr:replicative helicase loader/inhibitor [Bacillus sp. ISL-35]MBT2680934.1 hypothetical protein [Bacillus sp. ISL-35]MBT2705251.1 hypothetical protein [Chryseobacterium sp. ISL-80]